MPHYTQRGKRSWTLYVELPPGPGGKRKRETKTVKIEDDTLLKTTKKLKAFLDKELMKFCVEVESGRYIHSEKMTLDSFVKDWTNKYAVYNLEETTVKMYLDHIKSRISPRFGLMQMDQITTMHIIDFLGDLQKDGARLDGKKGALSSTTIDTIYKVIKNIFDRAVEWRLIPENIVVSTTKPKSKDNRKKRIEQKENPQWYTADEAHVVVEALYRETRKWRLLILGALLGGLRRAEVVGIEWKYTNFVDNELGIENTIPLTKNGEPIEKEPKAESYRWVSMPAWYMQELFKYRHEWENEKHSMGEKWLGGNREYIFHNGKGLPYYYQHPQKWWKRFCKRHGIRYIKFHGLRHSSGTILLEDENEENVGHILKAIQERLGHSRLSTTVDTYVHVTKKVKERTASKFDKFSRNAKKDVPKNVSEKEAK